MEMKSVKSSNITHIGWEHGKLHVTYKSGHTYEFGDVTEKQYGELMSAQSHGKHLNAMKIKGAKLDKK